MEDPLLGLLAGLDGLEGDLYLDEAWLAPLADESFSEQQPQMQHAPTEGHASAAHYAAAMWPMPAPVALAMAGDSVPPQSAQHPACSGATPSSRVVTTAQQSRGPGPAPARPVAVAAQPVPAAAQQQPAVEKAQQPSAARQKNKSTVGHAPRCDRLPPPPASPAPSSRWGFL